MEKSEGKWWQMLLRVKYVPSSTLGWVGGRMNGEEREVRERFAYNEKHGGKEGETPWGEGSDRS